MKIYKYQDVINFPQTTMLLGAFEAFHIGHLQLFEKAKEFGNPVGILVFDAYTTLHHKRPLQLTSLKVRLTNLSQIGFDFVIVATFNDKFQNTSARDFVDALKATCRVTNFVCGKDFRFGQNREWGVQELEAYFPQTHVVPIYKINDVKIGTRRIFENIQLGLIRAANDLMVNKFWIRARYKHKYWELDPLQYLPHAGIYYGQCRYNLHVYPVLIHVDMSKKIAIRMLEKLPLIFNDYVDLIFLDKKRLIIQASEDHIFKEEVSNLKYFFANYYKKS